MIPYPPAGQQARAFRWGWGGPNPPGPPSLRGKGGVLGNREEGAEGRAGCWGSGRGCRRLAAGLPTVNPAVTGGYRDFDQFGGHSWGARGASPDGVAGRPRADIRAARGTAGAR
jgi:hypothetical protein